MDDTTTQLLTLLNVSALKRKRPIIEKFDSPKLNKRKKTVQLVSEVQTPHEVHSRPDSPDSPDDVVPGIDSDSLVTSLGLDATLLSDQIRECVDQGKWNKTVDRRGKLGAVSLLLPASSGMMTPDRQVSVG